MKPSEIIRRAAAILNETGWCQGSNAVNASGAPVLLHEVAAEGNARCRINREAAGFSMYGAIAKAMIEADSAVSQVGMMWEVLRALAEVAPAKVAEPHHAHVHPVVLYNEHMDRTKEEVLGLLEAAAAKLESLEAAAGTPAPVEVDETVIDAGTAPQPVEVRGGITVDGRYMPAIGDATGVVGQIGFPKPETPPPPPVMDDARLPPVTPIPAPGPAAPADTRLPTIDWR